MHGKGVLTLTDGSSFSGEFKDGVRHGKGIYRWPNGKTLPCEFKHGERVEDNSLGSNAVAVVAVAVGLLAVILALYWMW